MVSVKINALETVKLLFKNAVELYVDVYVMET